MQATLVFKTGNMTQKQYEYYLHSRFGYRNRLENDAKALMRAVGAPQNRMNYDAEEWLPAVIDHWNDKHRNIHAFKAFMFGTSG
jgi:hypothetical protein